MNMNKFSWFTFFFITTSYLISPSQSDQSTQDLISQICRTVADPGFCYDALNKNIVSPQTDLPGLTRLTIGLSLSYAKDVEIFIQKAKAAENNAYLQKLYADCETNYHTVVGFMEGAKYDADRADYKSMVGLLQLCSRPIIDCQNRIGDIIFTVRDKNRHMRVFLSMGLYEGGLL